ncbi:major tail protein [Paraclostridium sordellii]|uniref:major tail protein n=1 Tax=Paraclostridium sordellii TaxID=1505 RepID=UPI0005E0CB88|nr:major tail protein [Paeniclostridium sordellii]CEQ26756.1 phi13 family phage major tail protein [[Clostridium] sordellii] [Paeniclostridium sordellii]
MYEEKILYGLNKIHYCKKDGIIKAIKGALDIEVLLSQEYEYKKKCGYDAIRFNSPIKGKGKLTLLGLTLEEQADLLGYSYSNGELAVGGNPNPPNISLFFARNKMGGGELYTVVYNCVFENSNMTGLTDNGELEEQTITLNFDVLVDIDKKLTYFTLDTNIANQSKVKNFFNKIQLPDRRN